MYATKIIIILTLCVVLALSGSHPVGSDATDPEFSRVDAYFQAQVAAWHIPGAALVIVQDGQVAHLQTFGYAGAGRPVTPQTPFEIGSCTKSFTALAVMQLVEAGRLDLDAPVVHYLPWFQVADPQASTSITVRNLLNQTSGLPNKAANRQTMVNPGGRTLEEQVRLLKNQALGAAPGVAYQYSNLNYMTLALVIEAVSGQSYGTYLNEHIFQPLSMMDSFTDPQVARLHGLSGGHTWWFGIPFKSLESQRLDMLGAGHLMTSPEDMAHWLIAQLNMGIYNGHSLLSSGGIQTMHTPGTPKLGEPFYGMGWVHIEQNGQTIVNHNGQSASFTCSMILLPEKGTGIAVLANVSSLLGPHAAASLAFHAKDMLATSQPVPMDPAYRSFYLPWDIGFLLATGFLLWSILFDLPRWGRKISRRQAGWRMSLPFLGDGLLMLAAFLALPFAVGFEIWRGMFVWQPDAVTWCLTAGTILLIKIVFRAGLLIRRQRKNLP